MLQKRSAALVAHRRLVDLLGERPTTAAGAVAKQRPHRQADRHRAATESEVAQRADIAAVHAC